MTLVLRRSTLLKFPPPVRCFNGEERFVLVTVRRRVRGIGTQDGRESHQVVASPSALACREGEKR